MIHPQLYSATYSNVPVYEFLVNGGSVMRRKKDNWVNATHILKAANFAKAKRTRILEKDVQTGKHEKVQGGYGKYQGTWVPLEDAKLIAARFSVQDILAPILEYVRLEGDDEPPLAPRHHHAKTLAAQAANKSAAESSRSTSGSPSLATRSSTYPLKRTKSKADPLQPPKKRGRPRRVNSVLESETPADSVGSSILDSGNFDMLKTIEDKPVELNKNGQPKKKRGRKPKPKNPAISLDESMITTTVNDSSGLVTAQNSIFQTPMKNSVLNNRVIRSFVDEKSSPLNENDLNSYFNSQADHRRRIEGTSSDIEETDMQNHEEVTVSRMFRDDPSSSPSEFMSDHDLARALKSPENMSGLGIKNRINGISGQRSVPSYYSFINGREDHPYNGYFSTKKKYSNNEYTNSIPTPSSSLPPSSHYYGHTNSNVRNDSKWFDENDEFTKKLINHFMKPDDEVNDQEIPDFLLNLPKKFEINKAIDPDGNTALHWACAMGNLPIIELLLKLGANYHARNKKQETPIMRTVRFNNSYTKRTFSKILDLLRETIFDVDGKNRTTLHHVALASSSSQKYNSGRYYSEMLLAKVRDLYSSDRLFDFINLTDRKGNTALFYALSNSSRKCVKVLLSHGARTDIKNNKGESANDLMAINYPPTPKLISNYQSNVRNLNKLIPSKDHGNKQEFTVNNDTITEATGGKIDITSLPHILQAPKYSEVVISAVEKTAISLIESLNNFADLYDEELQKKQVLIYDLNKYYNELNIEISTLEKNIINSSISANQLLSSSMSDVGDEDPKSELAKSIIATNYKKLGNKIDKQSEKLNDKIKDFETLLHKIQLCKLNQIVASEETNNVKLKDNDGDIQITDSTSSDSTEEKLQYAVELSKLQLQRGTLTKKIFGSFIFDAESVQNTDLGIVDEDAEMDTLVLAHKTKTTVIDNSDEIKARKEKSKKLNLYRRLVAACCNIGINEVDELIDTVLDRLQH